MDNMETTRNKMTYKEAERIIKNEMCKNCGIYLGGGKCDKDCRVIQCIDALSNKESENKKCK